ncbi:hypothetical protein, partial [Alloiococcus otitis]|uniref:hypothetical protein n=1 Tax=Alloiococcus otitis TaxID=1652 RepID=UPI00058BA3EE
DLLSSFNFETILILIYCPVLTSKLPYFYLLSSFNFETSLFGFIVQFQLQNFPILIYCPVSTSKLSFYKPVALF